MRADDPRHGSLAGYQARCRQTCCTAAKRRYDKEWQARKPELDEIDPDLDPSFEAWMARHPKVFIALGLEDLIKT